MATNIIATQYKNTVYTVLQSNTQLEMYILGQVTQKQRHYCSLCLHVIDNGNVS